ncbi:hypothetical protein A2480_03125 [Candidatus Uhrbacteria bacterium RIFOXYC2_FULL_47_19]|uniref:Epoxyqueuosine reductase QueH n=1 Tax=Candidatus Uhrbacteria bacterium RIFOXYC2_FULL_47_19 TaxID=1802424 RepID=A0A1F7WDV0_9BACT|nr:MAG: hypothetical protein A2480_03125 [Candidatus Uhrbacteria bacterium RIFOXYC2_FULL_47_19]HCC21819.1 recombinase [Candidatus Uhrbacteria bacterium]
MPIQKVSKNRLLLHACCAPCSIAVINELRVEYELYVLFFNPNIHPEAEYLKRKSEVVRVCREWKVSMIDLDYESTLWEELVAPVSQKKEGGPRCSTCFRLRLARTADYAKEHGFVYFATSLTMGRRKDSTVINAIGRTIAVQFGLKFLDTNWKKGGRWETGRRLTEEWGIYRQSYCGCRFSLEEMAKR